MWEKLTRIDRTKLRRFKLADGEVIFHLEPLFRAYIFCNTVGIIKYDYKEKIRDKKIWIN